MTEGLDKTRLTTWFGIEKYTAEQVDWVEQKSGIVNPSGEILRQYLAPDEVSESDEPNLTTTAGLGRITDLLTNGTAPARFTAANVVMLGVGDTATAATAADTQLGSNSAAHSWYIPADSAPTRVTTTVTNDTVQIVGTFNTSNSDFVWQEWGIVLGTVTTATATFPVTGSPILFNHLAPDAHGTKLGGSWVATAKLKFA